MLKSLDKEHSNFPIYKIFVRCLGLDNAFVISLLIDSYNQCDKEKISSNDGWFSVPMNKFKNAGFDNKWVSDRLHLLYRLQMIEFSFTDKLMIKFSDNPFTVCEKIIHKKAESVKKETDSAKKEPSIDNTQLIEKSKLFAFSDEGIPYKKSLDLEIIEAFKKDSKLLKAWKMFAESRTSSTSRISKGALVLLSNKLKALLHEFSTDEVSSLILKAVENEWKTFGYDSDLSKLRKGKRIKKKKSSFDFTSEKDVDYTKYNCMSDSALKVFVEFFEQKYGEYSVTENEKYNLSRTLNALIVYHKFALVNSELYRQSIEDVRPVGLARLIFELYINGKYADTEFDPKDIDFRFGKLLPKIFLEFQKHINLSLSNFEQNMVDKPFNIYSFLEKKGLLEHANKKNTSK